MEDLKENLNEENILELSAISGEKFKFYVLGVAEEDNNEYYLLQPVNLLEGMSENDVIVFKKGNDNDKEHFELVEDDDLVEKIISIHNNSINK